MMKRALLSSAAFCTLSAALVLMAPHGMAQRDVALLDPDEAQVELERATRESQQAEARAARLLGEAESATEAADKAAREAAAIAAQVQQSEAGIAAARARFSLATADREAISARLAERRQPLARLTGALQTTARRPLALSALQPGSLKELVYVRAVLDGAVPEIRARTASLRSELEESRRLEVAAAEAIDNLRQSERDLQQRREALAALETRQRLASREARNSATRESERALALAEEARDLDGLVDRLGAAASLRAELAALPGPVLRPANLGRQEGGTGLATAPQAASAPIARPTQAAAPPRDFQLPVQGRTIAGFGAMRESGLRSTGITLSPAPGAQVVAPASGRVAFAGPYRGYGRIVIIEHPGGWTSLVTGLERISVAVGDTVIGGSPLGLAAAQDPAITLELRSAGDPVNPLQFLG